MYKQVWSVALVTFMVCLVSALLDVKTASAAVPKGFEDRLVANVGDPTALAFAPDGRMLITTQTGLLRVHENGALRDAPALNIASKVCGTGERGLLGVALDPKFGTAGNNYVYLYYTYKKFGVCPTKDPANPRNPVNRVSRFTMNGDTVDPRSEKVLIDDIRSPNGNHNAGDLHFGKDGFLYVSVGDGGCSFLQPSRCQPENDIARYKHVLNGKILRVTRDGGIPATNPYTGAGTRRCNTNGLTGTRYVCQEIFASGLRNPFRMAFDPDAPDTSFRINDVGAGSWEEVNIGKRGADYGWNICEGRHDNLSRPGASRCAAPPLTPPITEYNHNTGCSSVTGGAFVPNRGSWPDSYDSAYLFGDYVCGRIFALRPKAGGGYYRTTFAHGLGQGGPVATTFGPYKGGTALYYTTYANGEGQVRRIAYAAGVPTAVAEVDQNYGDPQMTFDGTKSRDPQNALQSYEWDFGVPDSTEDTATGINPTYTYQKSGEYTVTLKVTDAEGLVSTDTVTVYPGDEPPQPTIESVSSGTFAVGQRITTTGSATDPDDGDNGAAPTLSWKVFRHHNGNHAHPYASSSGYAAQVFFAPAPEDLFATNPRSNYLEIRLTATDSLGLSRTVTRTIRPRTTALRFSTRPGGLLVRINGRDFVAPRSLISWENARLNIYAADQRRYGRDWDFRAWSDGRNRYHTIAVPTNPRNYTAVFQRDRR